MSFRLRLTVLASLAVAVALVGAYRDVTDDAVAGIEKRPDPGFKRLELQLARAPARDRHRA